MSLISLSISLLCSNTLEFKDFVAPLISLSAVFIAYYTLESARKNIRLSIQQAVIKTAIEKAKDCNIIWNDSDNLGIGMINPYYQVTSELVISKEIILKSFSVYSRLDKNVIEEKEDYAYIFWKQLNPAIRGFFTNDAVKIALNYGYKTTYGNQLLDVNDFIKKHNENQTTQDLFEKLRQLPEQSA